MDCTNKNFSINCESNPAFFKQCSVLWLDGWSRESMVQVSNFSVFLVHFTRNNNKYKFKLQWKTHVRLNRKSYIFADSQIVADETTKG